MIFSKDYLMLSSLKDNKRCDTWETLCWSSNCLSSKACVNSDTACFFSFNSSWVFLEKIQTFSILLLYNKDKNTNTVVSPVVRQTPSAMKKWHDKSGLPSLISQYFWILGLCGGGGLIRGGLLC